MASPDTIATCRAVVYKRDTYRVARGSKGGFRMHYDRCRCSRRATRDGLCTQHADMAAKGVGFTILTE